MLIVFFFLLLFLSTRHNIFLGMKSIYFSAFTRFLYVWWKTNHIYLYFLHWFRSCFFFYFPYCNAFRSFNASVERYTQQPRDKNFVSLNVSNREAANVHTYVWFTLPHTYIIISNYQRFGRWILFFPIHHFYFFFFHFKAAKTKSLSITHWRRENIFLRILIKCNLHLIHLFKYFIRNLVNDLEKCLFYKRLFSPKHFVILNYVIICIAWQTRIEYALT